MNELGEILQKTIQFFKTKGIDSARLDAELIFAHALKIQRIQLYTQHNKPLSETELENCRELVRRRTKGEPVAYLTGSKWFYQSEFKVSPAVLIPRPETELLVEHAVKFATQKLSNKTATVLDLGSGTGCIGISIFKELVKADFQTKLFAVEKSESAFQILKENAVRLIPEAAQKDCLFVLGDASTVDLSVANGFDLILANPPYIEPKDTNVDEHVRQFEPHAALFADDGGMKDIKTWSTHALKFLKPGGLMMFEMGWDQAEKAKQWFDGLGLQNVEIKKDLSEHDRFVLGIKRN